MKAKYVEMDRGDFYRKYFEQEKFPNLRKLMAFKIALFGPRYLCEFYETSLSISDDKRTLGKWTEVCQHFNQTKFEQTASQKPAARFSLKCFDKD